MDSEKWESVWEESADHVRYGVRVMRAANPENPPTDFYMSYTQNYISGNIDSQITRGAPLSRAELIQKINAEIDAEISRLERVRRALTDRA